MAEIVPSPAAAPPNFLDAFFSFLGSFWWVLLLIAIAISGFVVAVYVLKLMRDNDRRRDAAVYATAQNISQACALNTNLDYVRKRWSWINLLWFGIPLRHVETSAKIVDMNNNFLGWYRGHCYTQNGDLVFRVYKSNFLLFFEDYFLIYCPLSFTYLKDGERVFEKLPPETILWDVDRTNSIRIKCETTVKQGSYYHFPSYVLVKGSEKKHLDLSEHIADNIARINHVVSLENAYADFSRAMGRASEVNPLLQYAMKEPTKEKEIRGENQPDK